MTKSTINQMDTNTFIDGAVQSANPNKNSSVLFSQSEKDEEKKELKKKLKAHHKMLSEKADENYEKDNKELARKYREMAKKLAEDMDDDNKELSLSSYEIDEASLSNPELSAMKQLKTDLTTLLSDFKKEITDSVTAQLSSINGTNTKLTDSEKLQKLQQVMDEASKLLGGK